jgi:hypothetical protein
MITEFGRRVLGDLRDLSGFDLSDLGVLRGFDLGGLGVLCGLDFRASVALGSGTGVTASGTV